MKKKDNKKPIKRSRMSQKQKAVQSLIILSIILFLCIVLVYLVPGKKNRGEKITLYESDKEDTGKIGEEKEKKEDFPPTEKLLDKKQTSIKEQGVVEQKEEQGKIAVVIDDAGNNIEDLLPFLRFPEKLSIAVLPQLPHSTEAATLIIEAEKEVILHQPMEAESEMNPGPGTLYSSYTEQEITNILKENLKTVPGALGASNHMGSKLTADIKKMEIVFHFFSEHGLYFLDSRTTNRSVCRKSASFFGMPLLERHIFLDYEKDKSVIREQMKKGIALAKKIKYVILIGHVQNKEVLDILYEFLTEPEENQYTFIGLSEICGK